jgi:beta-1,4-N-acetylglucosaminyltransferase
MIRRGKRPRAPRATFTLSRSGMNVLIVSSIGGHLTEVMRIAPLLARHRVALVVNDHAALPSFPFAAVYRVAHAERDWRVLLNLAEAARIFDAEQPQVLLSAGAGPAIPFAVVARLFTNCRVVYLESASAVTEPTLTGRLMVPLAHDFFYQWPSLEKYFPNGTLSRVVFP